MCSQILLVGHLLLSINSSINFLVYSFGNSRKIFRFLFSLIGKRFTSTNSATRFVLLCQNLQQDIFQLNALTNHPHPNILSLMAFFVLCNRHFTFFVKLPPHRRLYGDTLTPDPDQTELELSECEVTRWSWSVTRTSTRSQRRGARQHLR